MRNLCDLIFLALSAMCAVCPAAQNLCPNPDVETSGPGPSMPAGWQPMSTARAVAWDREVAHSGRHSLKIAWEGGATVGWVSDIVPLPKPGTQFMLSCWTRLEEVTGRNGAAIVLYHMDADGKRIGQSAHLCVGGGEGTVATADWRRVTAFSSLTEDVKGVRVNVRLYGASGTAWFDDFNLLPIMRVPLEEARPLRRGLRLDTGAGIDIVSAEGAMDLAEDIRTALSAAGVEARITPHGEADLTAPGPDRIVLGNLAISRAMAFLYERYYTYEDLAYPGTGGWVLRPLIDPLGNGVNMLVAAWSDTTGKASLRDRLPTLLREASPGALDVALEVHAGSGCADPQAPEWTPSPRREMGPAARYLLTGERRYADEYRELVLDTWLVDEDRLYDRGMANSLHLFYVTKTLSWDLMESSGVFSDAERLALTRVLLGIMRSDQGTHYMGGRTSLSSRENHSTRAARAFYFGWRYFDKYYGDSLGPEAAHWRELLRLFWRSPFASARSYEDSISQHALGGTLDNTLDIAMMEPEWAREWWESGRARQMGERCLAVCNNSGHCVLSGDTGSGDYPASVFAKLAWRLRDGRYVHALRLRGGLGVSSDEPMRRFCGGVSPVTPADHVGLKVIPSDELYVRTALRRTGPVTLADGFDKLTVRSGFAPGDEYLLIDGVAGGSHSYDDANTICEYSANDRRWLCQIDIFNGPTMSFHNAVTVARDGVGEPTVPQAAALRHHRTWEDAVYTATQLPDYNGVDWTRHLFWLEGQFVFVVDEMVAREEADYSFVLGWRSLGSPALEPGRLSLAQDGFATDAFSLNGAELTQAVTATSGKHYRCLGNYNALLSRTTEDGDFVEVTVDLEQRRQGPLSVSTLNYEGRGIMQVSVDGAPIGEPVDMFRGGGAGQSTSVLGEVDLEPGPHRIRFTITGKHPASDNRYLGVTRLAIGTASESTRTEANRFAICFPEDVPATLDRDRETLGKYLPPSPFRDQALNILEQSGARHLKQGDAFCFVNLFYAAEGAHQPRVSVRRLDDHSLLVHWDDEEWFLSAGETRTSEVVPGVRISGCMVAMSRHGAHYQSGKHDPAELNAARAAVWEAMRADDAARTKTEATPGSWSASETWQPRRVVDLPAAPYSIAGIRAEKPLLAAGMINGSAWIYGLDGEGVAEISTGAAVRALCAADLDADGREELLIGSDDEHVVAVNANGSERWRVRIPFHRDKQPWMWWTLGSSKVRKLHAADLTGDGVPEIIVGAGNMRLQVLDARGTEQWRFRTDHGICTTIATADVFDEGRLRILAGNGLTSSNGRCWVLGDAGEILQTYSNEGWCTSLPAIAVADLNGDGESTVFCGNNRGNLRAFPGRRGRPEVLWIQNLTRPIRSLAVLRAPRRNLLLAASDSGTLCAFDQTGELVWHTPLSSAIEHVQTLGPDGEPRVLAGCKDGRLFVLSSDGTVLQRADLGGRLAGCTAHDSGSVAAITREPNRLFIMGDIGQAK